MAAWSKFAPSDLKTAPARLLPSTGQVSNLFTGVSLASKRDIAEREVDFHINVDFVILFLIDPDADRAPQSC
jgi:hypothetical protein